MNMISKEEAGKLLNDPALLDTDLEVRALTAIIALHEANEYVDYCLDKWRHGAPDALAKYAEFRMALLDENT